LGIVTSIIYHYHEDIHCSFSPTATHPHFFHLPLTILVKMRHALFTASALCGLTAALPQMINIEAALAVPTPSAGLGPKIEEVVPAPITYNQAAATESAAQAVATGGVEKEGSVSKRGVNDACALQPGG
jgi:hypothetical protein